MFFGQEYHRVVFGPFLVHCIGRYMMSTYLIVGNVNLEHLVR